jgi:hypothetical protein
MIEEDFHGVQLGRSQALNPEKWESKAENEPQKMPKVGSMETNNLLLWSKVINVNSLHMLEKEYLIEIILELNIRLNDTMADTEWLKNENLRLGNKS